MTQLSHPYMTTGKTMALTRRTFVAKLVCFLFHILSRFVIALLPRSKRLNFIAAVTVCSDFGAQENKICHCLHFFSFYFPWSDWTRCQSRRTGHTEEFWQNMVHWRREQQMIPVFLLWEPNDYEQYEKQKDVTLEDEPLPRWKVSNMLLEKSRRQVLTEKMKRLGQSGNNTQL